MTRFGRRSILAPLFVGVLIAACGGSGTTTTTRTVAPGTPKTFAIQTFTNIGEVDQVASAAVAHDSIELAGLTGYQSVACKKDGAQAPGDPPRCRDSEADGALVEVLASSKCEGGWVRPEQVSDAFTYALAGPAELVAAYKPAAPPNAIPGGPSAGQVLVFRTGTSTTGVPHGSALHIKNGRVVWIEIDCQNLSEFLAPERVDSFIIEPKGIAAPTPVAPLAQP